MNDDKNIDYFSSSAEIIHYYDSHLNLTLKELSDMTGKSIAQLKALLLNQKETA